MTRKTKMLDKILVTRAKLDLWVAHGDVALDGQDPRAFACEVKECLDALMDFRNIVNAMVSLEDDPKTAAAPYITD